MKPDYSIVVPCYNKFNWTYECVFSIMENSNYYYELIIVSNGSTDETNSYFSNLQKINPKIVLLTYADAIGGGVAINAGFKIARGHYIITLNNDAKILGKDWIEILRKPFDEYEKVGVTGPLTLYSAEADVRFVVFCCAMTTRKVLDDAGYLNEEYEQGFGSDIDFCKTLVNKGYKVLDVPKRAEIGEGIMVGQFPIYHPGEISVHDLSDWENIKARSMEKLRNKYESKLLDKTPVATLVRR